MSHEEFSRILSQSGSKQRNMSIFMFVVGGIFMAVAAAAPDNVTLWARIFMGVLSGLCVVGAVALFRKAGKSRAQVKNGTHPLLNAIQNGDRSYVTWFYEEIVTVNNVNTTAAHQILIFDRNNTSATVSVKGAQVADIFQYLHTHFPEALMGYSEENKKRYKQHTA